MSILSTGIEIGEKGLEIGQKKGLEVGIAGLIHMGKELHLSEDVILEQLCKSFDLDQATARKYLDTFEK